MIATRPVTDRQVTKASVLKESPAIRSVHVIVPDGFRPPGSLCASAVHAVNRVTVDGTAGHGPEAAQSCAEPTTESWPNTCACAVAANVAPISPSATTSTRFIVHTPRFFATLPASIPQAPHRPTQQCAPGKARGAL